jgi:hypothetical protein
MSEVVIRPADQPGDLGWVVMVHGEVYAAEYGWGSSFEALVARIVADYAADHDPQYEAAWIATVDGERVGCVFCVRGPDDGTPNCGCCSWRLRGEGSVSGPGWLTPASGSPALPATRGWCCGPTTR